jgi:hypothetical protein
MGFAMRLGKNPDREGKLTNSPTAEEARKRAVVEVLPQP